MPDLSAVAYKSRATPHCSDVDLYYLLAQARSRNGASDLTGVLVYDRGYFFQWLEGPREQLRQVWASIGADPRHADLEVVFDDRRLFRLFEGWGMQFAHRDKDQQRTVRASFTFDACLLDELHASPRSLPELFATFGTASGLIRHPPTAPTDDDRIHANKRFTRLQDPQHGAVRLSTMHQLNASEKLQRAGSAARAAGIGALMNPFYQSGLMPATTGETVHDWQAKVEAWDQGWLMEDMVGIDSA